MESEVQQDASEGQHVVVLDLENIAELSCWESMEAGSKLVVIYSDNSTLSKKQERSFGQLKERGVGVEFRKVHCLHKDSADVAVVLWALHYRQQEQVKWVTILSNDKVFEVFAQCLRQWGGIWAGGNQAPVFLATSHQSTGLGFCEDRALQQAWLNLLPKAIQKGWIHASSIKRQGIEQHLMQEHAQAIEQAQQQWRLERAQRKEARLGKMERLIPASCTKKELLVQARALIDRWIEQGWVFLMHDEAGKATGLRLMREPYENQQHRQLGRNAKSGESIKRLLKAC